MKLKKELIMRFFLLLFGFTSLALADTIVSNTADNPPQLDKNTVRSHEYGERKRVIKPVTPPPQPVIVVPAENNLTKPNNSPRQ